MTLGLEPEHVDLRDSIRGWASRHVTADVLHTIADADDETLPPYWQNLAEQGLLALHIPDDVGGAGAGLVEAAVVVEELGYNIVPGPAMPTIAAGAVLTHAQRTDLAGQLADGSTVGAVGLEQGSLILDDDAVSGQSGPVLSGGVADLVIVPVDDTWVVLDTSSDQVDTESMISHDVTRRFGVITCHNAVPLAVLDVDSWLPREIMVSLLAAESSGLARWAVDTAAEYAKVREQFGRKIGQFQGVKHRVATMLARAEQARAVAWDANRVWDDNDLDPKERSLAVATAGAIAVSTAVDTAKDLIQVLGGIGYTWEHDAHLYMRRGHTTHIVSGATTLWRQRVADLIQGGVLRTLSVELPESADVIRQKVRDELQPATELSGQEQKDYLAEKGYTAPHFKEPWGKSADPVAQLVIADELASLDLEPADMVIGNWVVPTLIVGGSDDQLDRFMARTLNGELDWCQLFSEPGAGSDLASLSTKAVKVDGGWKINGQKVWTSRGHLADWGILLARTNPDVPKNKGISYFLVDMKNSKGLDIRPLREITGEALFNEVFFNDVFVPDDCLVGQPGDGWKLALNTLANERVALSKFSSVGTAGETILKIAAETKLTDVQRAALGKILADAASLSLLGLRATLRAVAGGMPGAESSIAKLLSAAHQQELWETASVWEGTNGLIGDRLRGHAVMEFLAARHTSIAGGTTEVQLNIIGERILGLPRDPKPGT